jgi:small subunit ribosomal protein S4
MKKVQKYKICRRLGSGVFEKCQTAKFVASEAKHLKNSKNKRPKVLSGFALQFAEKQKVRLVYSISEKQLSNYIKVAISKKDIPGTDYLFELLESRLDNAVYRLGLATTRRLARQIVSHGHILLNGKKTTIASAKVKLNDVISVREGSKKSVLFSDLESKLKDYTCPNWLSFNISTLTGVVQGKPKNNEGFFDLNTVLEFYSR